MEGIKRFSELEVGKFFLRRGLQMRKISPTQAEYFDADENRRLAIFEADTWITEKDSDDPLSRKGGDYLDPITPPFLTTKSRR